MLEYNSEHFVLYPLSLARLLAMSSGAAASVAAGVAAADAALAVVDRARSAAVRPTGRETGEVAFGKHATVRREEVT